MSGDLSIRPARRYDVATIVMLLAADDIGGPAESTAPEDLKVYLDQFERIDESPCETLYVAEVGGEVVGTFQIMIARTLTYRASTRAVLEAVQVRPDMRGRRIGEAMVRFAIEQARSLGASKLALTSNVKRLDAHRFYERLGFERSHAGFKLDL